MNKNIMLFSGFCDVSGHFLKLVMSCDVTFILKKLYIPFHK